MSILPTCSSQNINGGELHRIMASHYKEYSYAEIKAITNGFKTVIGEGGYGTVYKGHLGNVQVAVKIFKKYEDKVFLRELENMMYISHPNVIVVRGISHETNLCILTDFMEKGSFQDIIDNKPGCMKMDRGKMLQMFIVLCKTLQDFHGKNFFHLDIKPSNILFDQAGNPKYADFNGSYFFAEEASAYTFTHGGWTPIYMDPFSIADGFGYHTDIYAFGMTMLAILTKRKNIKFMLRDGRDVFYSNDFKSLKDYFTEEWHDEIGMKMLSCVMYCTKNKIKERIHANELAEELEMIKYEIDHGQIIEDLREMNLKNIKLPGNIPEVPCIVIETVDNYNSSYELMEDLIRVFKNLSSSSASIAEEEISNLNFVPLYDYQQSKNTFMFYDVNKIYNTLQLFVKFSISITFCNVDSLNFEDNIVIEDDIIMKSNKNFNLNIKKENFILIKGEVKVMMVNVKVKNCKRTNKDYAAFHLTNGASLIMKDVDFVNNQNQVVMIYVGGSCKLNMKDCTFDGNKRFIEDILPTCIIGAKKSSITLKDCIIRNHGGFKSPYEKSDCLIVSHGHVSISNCTFKNNLNEISQAVSFLFDEEAEVIISNSIFKNCSNIYFRNKCKGVIKECRFEENGRKSDSGGVISTNDNAEIEIIKCDFINNIAAQGGSINCRNYSKVNIKKSTFDSNKAYDVKYGAGGAMLFINNSRGNLEDCMFIDNHAVTKGGALAVMNQAKLKIKRCCFEKNLSLKGIGNSIYFYYKSNIENLIANVYINSTEEDESNVFIWKRNE